MKVNCWTYSIVCNHHQVCDTKLKLFYPRNLYAIIQSQKSMNSSNGFGFHPNTQILNYQKSLHLQHGSEDQFGQQI